MKIESKWRLQISKTLSQRHVKEVCITIFCMIVLTYSCIMRHDEHRKLMLVSPIGIIMVAGTMNVLITKYPHIFC